MKTPVILLLLILLMPMGKLPAQPPGVPSPPAPGAPTMPGVEPGSVFMVPREEPAGANPPEFIRPQYRGVSLDIVLQEYAQRTGKVIIRDPRVSSVNITLESREQLPVDEFLRAVESLLSMNNIAIVPFRDMFLKVVPADSVVRSGIEVNLAPPGELAEEDGVVSQLVELRFLEFAEVQALITERLSPNAKVQQIERANSILVTDSRANIRRILDILRLIDRPAEIREEVRIYQIMHATATEIKGRLEELISESQAELARQRTSGQTRTPVRTPPGVIRPGGAQTSSPSPVTPGGTDGVGAPGLVRGRVQMVADDRTNILLIISRAENDEFFERMIETLDRKVDPDITVRIHSLQFADAEQVATTLNELIGAATRETRPGATDAPTRGGAEDAGRSGQTLREFIQQRALEREAVAPGTAPPAGNIGQLSEQTRILADQRTNTLLLMGRNADLDVIEEVIAKLDIMLAQVMVRAIIMEVNLSDTFSYGIDWLQRSLTVNNRQTVDGVPIREPVAAFGGGQTLSGGGTTFRDGGNIDRQVGLSPGGLTYFTTFYDFNLDAVLRFAEGRSDTKVIATPIIMTTDNTEANIRVGERRAVPTNSTTTTGIVQTQIEFINIGIDLTVTPRINPQGVVVMEITQSTEDIGGVSIIDGNEVPNINSRQLNASLAIPSGGTLVLGGLVREDERESVTRVPFFGSIPVFGALFRSKSTQKTRTELLVLISPEVVLSAEEASALTTRLKNATEMRDTSWHRGWEPTESSPSESLPPEAPTP
jgi:general secretion pathway protein D